MLIAEGRANPLQNELHRAVERDRQAVALQKASRHDAREGVARARIVSGKIGTGHLPGAPVAAAFREHGRESGLVLDGHARDDHRVGPLFGQFGDHVLEHLVRAVGLVRPPQQCEDFREVRRQNVRLAGEHAHFRHHFVRDLVVEPPVVPEDRIDHDERLLAAEFLDEVRDDADLPRRAEVARVNGAEFEREAPPLGDDLREFVRQIEKAEVRILRVVRENRRRQGTDFEAHGGENRNDGRKRHAPEARKVVNGRHAANEGSIAVHGNFSVLNRTPSRGALRKASPKPARGCPRPSRALRSQGGVRDRS